MPSRAVLAGGVAAAALAAGTAALLLDRAPYPYSQRLLLDLPLPFLTRGRLDEVLQARAAEQMLEIGPGTGLQSLHVAPQLGPSGGLTVVDVQAEMLRHVTARAAARGIGNITARQADARALPFADATFDAAYLVTVLGEIPDRPAVLAELRRVLEPTGRLVVGEFADRHHVPLVTLVRLANDAGFHLTRRTGVPLAYYAAFTPCGAGTPS
jgi:ubiquinone/menaquinone biosynthesis C-methylase UbiE